MLIPGYHTMYFIGFCAKWLNSKCWKVSKIIMHHQCGFPELGHYYYKEVNGIKSEDVISTCTLLVHHVGVFWIMVIMMVSI